MGDKWQRSERECKISNYNKENKEEQMRKIEGRSIKSGLTSNFERGRSNVNDETDFGKNPAFEQ